MTAITVHRFDSLQAPTRRFPRPAQSVEPPLDPPPSGGAADLRPRSDRGARPDAGGSPSVRPPLPHAVEVLIDRAAAGLIQACTTRSATERYVGAHLAALRAAAAVVAVRGQGKRGGPRSVWELVQRSTPELADWAAFFADTATRRAAIESGREQTVSPREADALLQAAEQFLHQVQGLFGLPQHPVLPQPIPPCTE